MKEVLGIFAAIAAVAGIAAAVSKDDDKKEAEQRQREQELELEERRLTVEAAQRKHIQQMEQQRMQMEWEKRNYQMKLANAPKKPVYKTVASLQCPLCMGHREVNEAAGEVHCPYCGANEQLEIDHYEIDQVAFQKQLQEEEQQRAAQEKLRQRNERFNTALMIVAVIMVITFLILLFSPIVGIAFFTPPFLLFCFLLYKRYPENGGKVWNAIKFPLTCIFVFPLPLTALFMGSAKMEERCSKKARIGMSIGAWAMYAALIFTLGGLYVKGFRNAVHSDPPLTNVSTQEQTAERTTKATTAKTTAKPTTTTQAKARVEIPSKDKKQMGYFDSKTNAKIQIGSAEVEIPNNWIEQEEYSTEKNHTFFDNTDFFELGELAVYYITLDKHYTENVFRQEKTGLLDSALSLFDYEQENFLQKEININQHNGIYGAIIGNIKDTDIQYPLNCYFSLLFDEASKQVIFISLLEFHDDDSTYFNDYSKIVQSVRFASDEAETSASDKPETIAADTTAETEFTIESTTDAETDTTPEIYPQKDAFRAAVVAITNSLATDVFTNDGSRHDVSKYHSFSDTSAFYMSVLSQGTWTEKNNNTWHVDGLRLQPDGYDVVFNTPINFYTIAKVSLDVTFDGSNYIISNISGIYAIPGKEDIGTNLSYLNSDSMSKSALTVSANMIASGR